MKFPCELWSEFFGEKIGIREIFSIEFFFYRNQKISKLPAVKIYFSDASFFQAEKRKWGSVTLGGLFQTVPGFSQLTGWFQTFHRKSSDAFYWNVTVCSQIGFYRKIEIGCHRAN